MPLKSSLLAGDERLEACLVQDSAHLIQPVKGDFVGKVQTALIFLDDLTIDESELTTQTYGPSTAGAVLKFKQKRKIINKAYQQHEDDIVGRMTIKALDDEMALAEAAPQDLPVSPICLEKLE
ncbi:conserved hypothetical protein [Methylocella silvestris BL2]|uniref:Uncharacterized protein n=1 Tax=Methylocella silvestris (strain DSM 15510 / CIP 108128 / LMG 27833 / NCIMB 13906 / BL2) TaxID=395965 RepID=B8ETI9_METSB|nr:hypothetical protein [Methylocella silvestris]ACK52341.1 conserved hypothetical protein [Methylocella silvestris BL2]